MRERLTQFFGSRTGIVITGVLLGVIAALLVKLGNPANMGVCMACFVRDITGALGMHRAAAVQYLRPEIPAAVLGSLVAALAFGEFRPRGGSAPALRFVLGAFAMIGALVFLGCPWRALLRLAGGDLNAVLGLAGLGTGVAIGAWLIRSGFTLGRAHAAPAATGWILPGLMVALVVLAFVKPTFLLASDKGPGTLHAPLLVSLGAGLFVGFLAQRSRFCTTGAIRNAVLLKDYHLLTGVAAMVLATAAVNGILGQFELGFAQQPIAHSNHLWNVLGMVLAGLAFALAGGCPGRQLFRAGEGDGDAAIVVLGMVMGAAFAHNFGLAAKPDKLVEGVLQVGGPAQNGQIAVALGLVFCLGIGFAMREK